LLVGSALGVALAHPLAPKAQEAPNVWVAAQTYTVFYGDDTDVCDSNGCTLRGAINATNANPGADTIVFAGANLNITLNSVLPFINDDVTIDGAGHAITVSGNNSDRVLVVNSGKTLNLNVLTIANGAAAGDGGGIYNNGTLNVTNSTFNGNTAGNAGGAIINLGTLDVTNSTFYSNTASNAGGGISNNGTLNVTNSTFYSNTTSNAGGGGAIINTDTMNVTNSTFYSNTAAVFGGGILNYIGTLTVTNSTVSGNNAPLYGGIGNTGEAVTLYNTIIANNTGGGLDCGSSGGTFTANPYNLDSDDSCDQATPSAAINLSPLADNGGATKTMALPEDSAATDAGDDAVCPATDQRGEARPYGTHCDVGAFEYVRNVDLSMSTKTVTPTTARPGESVQFEIIVRNDGTTPTDGLVITDTIPAEIASISNLADVATNGLGSLSLPTANELVWEGTLNASGLVRITFDAVLTDTLRAGDTVTNAVLIQDRAALITRTATLSITEKEKTTVFLPVIIRGGAGASNVTSSPGN
jgi:uncharacterized repeat protein (TIGR01451 family)